VPSFLYVLLLNANPFWNPQTSPNFFTSHPLGNWELFFAPLSVFNFPFSLK
jgi:hypothetical protein